jgi:hypothetical protein
LLFLGVSASARLGVYSFRTGGRVVEGAGLENRYARKGIEGSNPSLSVELDGETRRRAAQDGGRRAHSGSRSDACSFQVRKRARPGIAETPDVPFSTIPRRCWLLLKRRLGAPATSSRRAHAWGTIWLHDKHPRRACDIPARPGGACTLPCRPQPRITASYGPIKFLRPVPFRRPPPSFAVLMKRRPS